MSPDQKFLNDIVEYRNNIRRSLGLSELQREEELIFVSLGASGDVRQEQPYSCRDVQTVRRSDL